MWPSNERFAALFLLTLLLMLGGCASAPPSPPETSTDVRHIPLVTPPKKDDSDDAEAPPAQPRSQSRESQSEPTPALCAWSRTRGVASLLAVEGETGTWQFFPGDDIVFHRVPSDAGQGAEYRAILERPLNGPCEKVRLILVAPL